MLSDAQAVFADGLQDALDPRRVNAAAKVGSLNAIVAVAIIGPAGARDHAGTRPFRS
jgi:hypothetical protein